MSDSDVLAYVVTFGELEGTSTFDWNTMRWLKRED
jgi:hypothetical protein